MTCAVPATCFSRIGHPMINPVTLDIYAGLVNEDLDGVADI
jgi:hypothetical protein